MNTLRRILHKNPENNETTLKTSFILCAETEINPSNFRNQTWILSVTPPENILQNFACFSVTPDFNMGLKRKGFLTLGRRIRDFFTWDRYWCVLDGGLLSFCNNPTECNCLLQIDLNKCVCESIKEADRTFCPRSRCLMIDIQNDGGATDRYFLRADNFQDLRSWVGSLNLVMGMLQVMTKI